ncbi:MAG: guanylate kinase [Deltaproteobacteria bacterium]|nr:guanylate kinase [Deltaproteobacteria bacterium]
MSSSFTKGRLVILSAPSGTGKTSVIQKLLKQYPRMIHSISCTTRSPRGGEKEGADYHFIPEQKFKQMIHDNEFAEWAEVHGCFYGTPKAPLDKWLLEERDVILDLDVQGGMRLKNLFGSRCLTIFLLPPSVEELIKRLSSRGTDSEEAKKLRIENARHELGFKDQYDFQVINRDLDQACKEIIEILGLRS